MAKAGGAVRAPAAPRDHPRTVVVCLGRDLRVHDHPALARAAAVADHVVPLFVLDDGVLAGPYAAPNRVGFLLESLADLRARLRERGGDLVVRRGDTVREVLAVTRATAAGAVFASADVSGFAQRRERRLEDACRRAGLGFETFPGVTVVPPGEVRTAAGGGYRVFTPFLAAWSAHPWRRPVAPPRRIRLPGGVAAGDLPAAGALAPGPRSPHVAPGGETAARRLLASWGRSGLRRYPEAHDDLAGDGTSRISPYLHLGCVSPLELASRWRDREGGAAYVRQLAWRDFHHQTTYDFPAVGREELRPRGDRWRHDDGALAAWQAGRTGYPIVDAGMRQLLGEGWMHNRARLVTASFLTKTLYVDWRAGAAHFLHWLVDGDIANNSANWQWVAGTGTDTRPNRVLNPLRQAERFDPAGAYVRRWVPELAGIDGAAVHRPWTLPAARRIRLGYPDRIVDHDEAARRFREVRDR